MQNYIISPNNNDVANKVIGATEVNSVSRLQKLKKPKVKITSHHVTKKIRIYPNTQQIQYFNSLFGAHRYYYNAAVDYITDNKLNVTNLDFIAIRTACVPKKNNPNIKEWEKHINRNVKDNAVQKAIDAYTTCNKLKENGVINNFERDKNEA